MQTSKEVVSAIVTGGFNSVELHEIYEALKFARNRVAQQNTFTMRVGAAVKFTSSRTGNIEVGTVTKVNRKTIMVRVGTTNWKVSASMLSPA
jgi:hypothetical protein